VIENPDAMLPKVGSTFHGRDLFAPVVAHLAAGMKVSRIGKRLDKPVMLPPVAVRVKGGEIHGEIVYVDRFGNLVSNISPVELGDLTRVTVYLGRKKIGPVQPSYDAVSPGRPVAVIGGFDRLEVSVNRGSAADLLEGKVGRGIRAIRGRLLLSQSEKKCSKGY
jgi:S-adenosylmethionine hydrolase